MAPAKSASSSSDIPTEGPILSLITKRLRALRKKLNRISQMEESLSQGKTLNKEQEETLRSKSAVLAGIEELEKIREPLSQAIEQEIKLVKEKNDDQISDLLKLIYFGSVFDVKTLMAARDNLMERLHERSSCTSYDYVTDDGEPLNDRDFDLISMLGGLLVSRHVNSGVSHKDALQQCVERAKLWLANSKMPIEPNLNVSYAGLRDKLNKIMASDYFTITPELKAPLDVAAAVGHYSTLGSMVSPVENSPTVYRHGIVPNYYSYFHTQYPDYNYFPDTMGSSFFGLDGDRSFSDR